MTKPADAPDVLRLLRRVRSTRRFTGAPVTDDEIHEILNVARWTGSAMNAQPWAFIAVRNGDTLRAVAEASPNAGHVGGAPAAIFVVMPQGTGASPGFDEGRVAERMLVAAAALGLESAVGWVTGRGRKTVAELLGLPDDRQARVLVSLGHAAAGAHRSSTPRGQARRPLDELVHWERWTN
jgi:nitroreductase